MSFARAKRGNVFDDEIRKKSGLPGPTSYNVKSDSMVSFKYF